MIEQFANNAESTLDGGIDDSQTTLDVLDASSFPVVGQFRIRIDTELMLVAAVSSNTLTVIRGIEDTAAASHSTGVDVTHILTAGALAQFRDDGYPFSIFTPPVLSDFTGVNTTGGSTAVATDTGRGVLIRKPPQNGVNFSAWVKSAPATPYTVEAAIQVMLSQASNVPCAGLCFRQASDGNKIQTIDVNHSNITSLGCHYYSNLTTQNDLKTPQNFSAAGLYWFRLSDNGTGDRRYWLSVDGVNWAMVFTHGSTTNISPDQIGWFCDSSSGTNGYDLMLRILSWKETSDNV